MPLTGHEAREWPLPPPVLLAPSESKSEAHGTPGRTLVGLIRCDSLSILASMPSKIGKGGYCPEEAA